ncbi:hypothetical protein [Shinella sp.]|uniref:hypothetical protein n=1 Tax=Shinella sp. TaxID=1870904 RepID=UPI0029ACA4A0|nr:hypothetical protein [Shinella sp.]MDX3974150.1 hypothetical protein [Shinella sp.]
MATTRRGECGARSGRMQLDLQVADGGDREEVLAVSWPLSIHGRLCVLMKVIASSIAPRAMPASMVAWMIRESGPAMVRS